MDRQSGPMPIESSPPIMQGLQHIATEGGLFVVNMILKEASMSRYPPDGQYKKRSWCCCHRWFRYCSLKNVSECAIAKARQAPFVDLYRGAVQIDEGTTIPADTL